MSDENTETSGGSDCIVPEFEIPAGELRRYSSERDPHREKDIANYVELEAKTNQLSTWNGERGSRYR